LDEEPEGGRTKKKEGKEKKERTPSTERKTHRRDTTRAAAVRPFGVGRILVPGMSETNRGKMNERKLEKRLQRDLGVGGKGGSQGGRGEERSVKTFSRVFRNALVIK